MKLAEKLNIVATDIATAKLKERQASAKKAFDELVMDVITPAAENGEFEATIQGVLNTIVWQMLEEEGFCVIKKQNCFGYDTIIQWKKL